MKYELPSLPYDYDALEPHISEKVLRIHHDKHHRGYTSNSNEILKKLKEAREEDGSLDIKATLKALSYNIGGHTLHSLFWKNMSPNGGGKPEGKLMEAITKEFGNFSNFKDEFSEAAKTVEGSGWAALVYSKEIDRLLIMQIEKHNLNIYPGFELLMVIDVWEHAYYLDYENNRGEFVSEFWEIVNWKEVERRFEKVHQKPQ